MPSHGRFAVYGDDVDLRATARSWGLDEGVDTSARLAVISGVTPALREVPVHAVPLAAAMRGLLAVPADAGPDYRRRPDSIRAWALAARLGLHLVAAQQGAPSLTADQRGTVHGVWRVLTVGDDDAGELLDRLGDAMPRAAHAVALDAVRIWEPAALLKAFLDGVLDLAVRSSSAPPRPGRPRARVLPWTARWAEALADADDATVPLREDAADLVAGVQTWLATVDEAWAGAVAELSLQAPPSQDGHWILGFGIRTEAGEYVPAAAAWDGDVPHSDGDRAAAQDALLRGLGQCARLFEPVERALRQPAPQDVALTLEQAWSFISEVAPLLEAAGLVVRLPHDLTDPGLRARLRVGADPQGADGADLPDRQAVYAWEVALGDEPLSAEEVAELVAAGSPLVHWRGHWVRVDPRDAERLTALPEPGTLLLTDALGLALAGSRPGTGAGGPPGDGSAEVVADGAVAALVDRLRAVGDRPPAPRTPAGFAGELRPYQRRGVAWLGGMASIGLGAVLADDMGLGKGIQLIAYLVARGGGPHLVVCPTSVVGNWEREIRRFAPGLSVTRHHGTDRPDAIEPLGVVLTTYGTLRRDIDVFERVTWDVVTIDEAQHVKNPATAGAKAVRRLRAHQTVAMTGTPLENRLAELWSLLDATNPGLLGTRSRFARRYVKPIEKRRDPDVSARLRRLVAPFVLRRTKADPDVIGDLPDKIERTVVCPLTPEQALLYERAVQRGLGDDRLSEGSAMQRRGRILALITELKQICNHPAQALGEEPASAGPEGGDPPGSEPAPADPDGGQTDEPLGTGLSGRSGKLAVTREIVAEAVDGGERVLIFTQYVAMGRLLAVQLSDDLRTEVPMLHGGQAAGTRDRIVARFQGETAELPPPVLVVSLRAGGTGLNLTAATHVVHYDRWWNPAVEDQATDRAHRIGQTRTVEVHKLVSAGTVEERIADVLEGKRALAEAVVGAGEAWVTELSDTELAELVALGDDASIADVEGDGPALASRQGGDLTDLSWADDLEEAS